jgi:hypothetical protein
MLSRFRLYCKHSFYRQQYGMRLPLQRRIAAWVWFRLYAKRYQFPSVYRPLR